MLFLSAWVILSLPGRTLSQNEALALAYPAATFTRHEHLLTTGQAAEIKARAGSEPRKLFVVAYEAKTAQGNSGVAFFDTHVVRTQPETAMIALSPAGKIVRVEIVSFREPQEYLAPARWREQFQGKSLDARLSLKGDIRPLSGASLTATALTDAARRALALWEILYNAKP